MPRYVHAQRVPLHPNVSRRSASFFSRPLNGLGNFSKPLVYPGLLPGWQRRYFGVFSPSPTTARAQFNAPVTVCGAGRSLLVALHSDYDSLA